MTVHFYVRRVFWKEVARVWKVVNQVTGAKYVLSRSAFVCVCVCVCVCERERERERERVTELCILISSSRVKMSCCLDFLTLKVGQLHCPEMLGTNFPVSLHHIPQEQIPHQPCCENYLWLLSNVQSVFTLAIPWNVNSIFRSCRYSYLIAYMCVALRNVWWWW